MAEGNAITELDKKIVRALQGEFPLLAEPYKELADRIGIPEEVLLAKDLGLVQLWVGNALRGLIPARLR